LDVTPEIAGAFVVGRFKDGTPVTHYSNSNPRIQLAIILTIKATHGTRCPFHAHIRRLTSSEVLEKVTLEQVKSAMLDGGISYSYPKNKQPIVNRVTVETLQNVSIDKR